MASQPALQLIRAASLFLCSLTSSVGADDQWQREGEPCDPSNPTWYPVLNCPPCFLYCNKREGVLVQDTCAEVKGTKKVFDFQKQRCLFPSAAAGSGSIQEGLFLSNAAGSGKVGDVCVFNTDCLQGMYCASGLCACLSTFVHIQSYCFEKINPSQQGCQYNEQCSAVWPGASCDKAQTGAAVGTCQCPTNYWPVETRDGYVCVFWGTRPGATTATLSTCPLPDIGSMSDRSRLFYADGDVSKEWTVARCRYGSNQPTTDASTVVQAANAAAAITALTAALSNIGKCWSRSTGATGYDVSDLYDCIPEPDLAPTSGTVPRFTEGDAGRQGICCPSRALVCSMPAKTSAFGGGTVRWYYNSVSGSCLTFSFDEAGPSNANNFKTREQCESYCKDRCPRGLTQYDNINTITIFHKHKPINCQSGSCTGNFECKNIGSGSNCCTSPQKICTRQGGLKDDLSTTFQPQFFNEGIKTTTADTLTGTNKEQYGSTTRYYYSNGVCERFDFYQQGGNFNNFPSRSDCETFCYSLLCEQGEPLKDANNLNQKCSSNSQCPSTHTCSKQGNVCCPTKQTVCEMPQRVGTCGNYVQRYWYNAVTRECEMFTYSGCQGNANNFATLLSCQNFCRDSKPRPQCIQGEPYKDTSGNYYSCHQTGLTSNCPANYECYYDGYMYGCCPTQAYTCSLSRNPGVTCGPRSTRWYYETSTQTCQSFEYLGCDGLSNNFPTRELCESYCGVGGCPNGGQPYRDNNGQLRVCSNQVSCPTTHECSTVNYMGSTINYCCPTRAHICSLPPFRGASCGGQVLTRYYFNFATKSCSTFSFEACSVGNPNNFATMSQCTRFCNSAACPAGESVYLDPNNSNKVMTCNPSLPSSCPQGFACRFDALTSQSVCCGATDMGVCPVGERAYVDAFSQDARTCRPNIVGNCPNNFLCRFNNLRNTYYCCASTSGAICPVGRAPLRDQITSQPTTCSLNTVVNVCPSGYSCQSSVSGAYQGFCCTVNAVCPGGTEFFATAGVARTCTIGGGASSCPSGYTCQIQSDVVIYTGSSNTGFCCKTTASSVCTNGLPYLVSGNPITCQQGQSSSCPPNYTCEPFSGTSTYYCCSTTLFNAARIFTSGSDQRCPACHCVPKAVHNGAPLHCAPIFSSVHTGAFRSRASKQNQLPTKPIAQDGCPVGQGVYRVGNTVQPCLQSISNSCPPNYSCVASATTSTKFQCCGTGNVGGSSVATNAAPPPPRSNPQITQANPPMIPADGCPPGHFAYTSPGSPSAQTCSLQSNSCPSPYSCQWSKRNERYQCCGANGGCPGKSVAYVDATSGQMQSCIVGSTVCPPGFTCQQTTMGPSGCCSTGQPLVHGPHRPRPEQTLPLPPPPPPPPPSPPHVFTPQQPDCPMGQSAYTNFGSSSPSSCSPGNAGMCPPRYMCQYSASRRDFVCCGTATNWNGHATSSHESDTRRGSAFDGSSTLGDGCLSGRAYLYPGTQSPLLCQNIETICPLGYSCDFSIQFNRFQCCGRGRAFNSPGFKPTAAEKSDSSRQLSNPFHNSFHNAFAAASSSDFSAAQQLQSHQPIRNSLLTSSLNVIGQELSSSQMHGECPPGASGRSCNTELEVKVENCCWQKSAPGLACVKDEQCQKSYRGSYCSSRRCVCPSYLLIYRKACVSYCPSRTINRHGECYEADLYVLKDDGDILLRNDVDAISDRNGSYHVNREQDGSFNENWEYEQLSNQTTTIISTTNINTVSSTTALPTTVLPTTDVAANMIKNRAKLHGEGQNTNEVRKPKPKPRRILNTKTEMRKLLDNSNFLRRS